MPPFPKNPRLYARLQFSQLIGRVQYAHNNVVYEGKSLHKLRLSALHKAITFADPDRALGREDDAEYYMDMSRAERMRRIMSRMRPLRGKHSLGEDLAKILMTKTSLDRESVLIGRILRRHFPEVLEDETIRVRIMSPRSIESERRHVATTGAWTKVPVTDQLGKVWPAGSQVMLDRKGRMRIASDSLGPIIARKLVTFAKPSQTASKQVASPALEF